MKVFEKAFNTNQYIVLQKNGEKAFKRVFHVHFHLFPMQSQTWSDVFDIVPQELSKRELEEQVNTIRTLFQT